MGSPRVGSNPTGVVFLQSEQDKVIARAIGIVIYIYITKKKLFTLLDLCVSSLRRGHANLLCIVPILTDDPRRESKLILYWNVLVQTLIVDPAVV